MWSSCVAKVTATRITYIHFRSEIRLYFGCIFCKSGWDYSEWVFILIKKNFFWWILQIAKFQRRKPYESLGFLNIGSYKIWVFALKPYILVGIFRYVIAVMSNKDANFGYKSQRKNAYKLYGIQNKVSNLALNKSRFCGL
jgi:hypothetical protein